MVFEDRSRLHLELGEELIAPFAGATVGVCEDGFETVGDAKVGASEKGEVFAGAVEELDAAGSVNEFGFEVFGQFPPGDVCSGVVFSEAGDDAGMPVCTCCCVGEVGAFAE